MDRGFTTEILGAVMIVRFVRPKIRNPLSVAVLEGLRGVLSEIERWNNIKAVIFTGSEDVFASGANLNEIALITPETAREFAVRGQSLMTKIAALPQKTVAAINGYCFGGALDLALACEMRIATPNASFAHPGTGLGIITGWGGTQRLPRLIGETKALEMFFSAKAISANDALFTGLIDKIADDVIAESLAYF